MHYLQRWSFFGLLVLLIACSATDTGQNRAMQGAYAQDLYLTMVDGNGASTTWGPLTTEDGRYYDVRPFVSADGVYEFIVQDKDQTLTFGYDRIRFDTDDEVVALQGTQNPNAFKIPLKGPGSYRFLFDTRDVARPLLTVTASRTLNSVEYKLMLLPSRFTDVATAVEELRGQIESLVVETIGADALKTSAKGTPVDKKWVYYYDTPGDCMLKRVGLILRERQRYTTDGTIGAREFTLKVRGADETEISQAYATTKYAAVDTKLEEEVSFAGNKDVYALKKSYSYSLDQNVPSDQPMAAISDFTSIYPTFYVRDDQPKLIATDGLLPTYETGFVEQVYVLANIDLAGPGDNAMERTIELTVWTNGSDQGAPVVAELSFKMKELSGNFSKSVRAHADALFEGMNGMEYWVSPDGITKTNFAYGFDPSFCRK